MQTQLFEQARHQKLSANNWDQNLVIDLIEDIQNFTQNSYRNDALLWCETQAVLQEQTPVTVVTSLYEGAIGTIIGLKRISSESKENQYLDDKHVVENALKLYRQYSDKTNVPSIFLGDSSLLFMKQILNPTEANEHDLYQSINSNIENPSWEMLWGSPGTMILALEMWRRTKNEKWKTLYLQNADTLINKMQYDEDCKSWIWVQDLYGNIVKYVGAGHGFAGNVYPLLLGIDLLSTQQQNLLMSRSVETLKNTAVWNNNACNWPARFDKEIKKFLVQWCHGAPGIIYSFSPFPKGINQDLETMLLGAGELIWQAGPLAKPTGICHGTDGNGYALLKLYNRTNDSKWLDRARAFAMHAINQRRFNHSLWTGDMGLACFLQACIDLDDRIPGLEYF